ncbi:TetR/AcrR family transcriptional regulator [Nocardia sp. NPDC057440]|uniref:TetR/AcrR family transcriptional regulator n=1 Tax=Nocardia sp. NPDC057440 TaxID=3346134 RepID=UPI00366D5DA3
MSIASSPSRMPGAISGYDARWEQHNSERQTLILQAAVALLEESPAGTDVPVHLIAKRAGLAKSVVYRQFSGREELERRIRSYLVDDFARVLDAELDVSSGSIREILTRTIRAVADWMSDHPRLVEFARTGPTHTADPGIDAVSSLKLRMSETAQELIASIGRIIGADPAPFASVPFAVVTMVEGVLATWIRDPRPSRSRAEIVADLAAFAWYVLDGAARSIGLAVDPDDELTAVIAGFADAGPSAVGL